MYELWVGTPHAMHKLLHGSLTQVKKKAADELSARKEQADKFDHRALDGVLEAREGIYSLTPSMLMGSPRMWQFDFIGITYRIEVRKA